MREVGGRVGWVEAAEEVACWGVMLVGGVLDRVGGGGGYSALSYWDSSDIFGGVVVVSKV